MDLGAHAGFILAAYAAALFVIGALVLWIVCDYRALTQALDDYERRGITRRSDRKTFTS